MNKRQRKKHMRWGGGTSRCRVCGDDGYHTPIDLKRRTFVRYCINLFECPKSLLYKEEAK